MRQIMYVGTHLKHLIWHVMLPCFPRDTHLSPNLPPGQCWPTPLPPSPPHTLASQSTPCNMNPSPTEREANIAAMQSLPALPAGTSLPQPASHQPEDTQQLDMGSLVVLSRQGSVKSYSRAVVKVSFTPPAAGPVRQQICIHFRYVAMMELTSPHCLPVYPNKCEHCFQGSLCNTDYHNRWRTMQNFRRLHACRAAKDKKLSLPDVVVTLTGLGRPVPVYMDTSLIDFKACFLLA